MSKSPTLFFADSSAQLYISDKRNVLRFFKDRQFIFGKAKNLTQNDHSFMF